LGLLLGCVAIVGRSGSGGGYAEFGGVAEGD